MKGWRSSMGWARKAPGARTSKILSVRAQVPVSRSTTVSAMSALHGHDAISRGGSKDGAIRHFGRVYVGRGRLSRPPASPPPSQFPSRLDRGPDGDYPQGPLDHPIHVTRG